MSECVERHCGSVCEGGLPYYVFFLLFNVTGHGLLYAGMGGGALTVYLFTACSVSHALSVLCLVWAREVDLRRGLVVVSAEEENG